MNRRDSLKALGIGTLSASAVLAGCHPKTGEESGSEAAAVDTTGRQPFEAERDKALLKATDAKVPDFIEFIVKDEPQHQLPMRGGLKWLDVYCLNHYNNAFKDCKPDIQKTVLDQIAYPMQARPDMQQGVAFFSKMRDLTAIGFFTSKMGIDDLGYKGNAPGKWEGVPADVLKQYGLEGV